MEILSNSVNFSNTQIAFSHKTDAELRKTAWLFRMMNNPTVARWSSSLAMKGVQWGIPFAETAIKHTIFEQFCGGTTLLDSMKTIELLAAFKTKTILDYGVERKEGELNFNYTMNENIRAIDFASRSAHIPFVCIKVTGLARFGLLEKIQSGHPLTEEEQQEYFNASKRVDAICHTGKEKGVSVMIDAEESWIQNIIDRMANMMMARYNRERPVVYNTFQMYRHDRLAFLKESCELAKTKGFILGAKLVRGAYMEKERKRAEMKRYATPIHPDKVATDKAFNDSLIFCVTNADRIACCNATHNAQSSMLLADLMEETGIPHEHPHFYFCQLLGMSDNITFNLAAAGYNVAKYMPYGPVREVVPYLVRRAQENSTVTGDMSREYSLLKREVERREKG